jgi:hypothetical protein
MWSQQFLQATTLCPNVDGFGDHRWASGVFITSHSLQELGPEKTYLKTMRANHQWFTPVMLATWKDKIRKIKVQGQPRQIF